MVLIVVSPIAKRSRFVLLSIGTDRSANRVVKNLPTHVLSKMNITGLRANALAMPNPNTPLGELRVWCDVNIACAQRYRAHTPQTQRTLLAHTYAIPRTITILRPK